MRKGSRRRVRGAVPRVGRALGGWARSLLRHPQTLLLWVALLIALWGLWRYVQQTDAFRVTQVFLPRDVTFALPTPLINRNLWDVDIRALASTLKRQEPSLKDVRVIRELPNAIRIDAIPRVPRARMQLGASRWVFLDDEGFLWADGEAERAEHVILVSGIQAGSVAVGAVNTDARVRLAARVIERLKQAKLPVAQRITEVNVSDPRQIRLRLRLADEETEVRCGSEDELGAHLERLQAALKAMGKPPVNVRYIDVRFPEPVIAPRT